MVIICESALINHLSPPIDATDFQAGFGTVEFQPNDTMACGQVRLKNDDRPEPSEVFMVTFRASNLVRPTPPTGPARIAEVTIIDDDRKCKHHCHWAGHPFTMTSPLVTEDAMYMGWLCVAR